MRWATELGNPYASLLSHETKIKLSRVEGIGSKPCAEQQGRLFAKLILFSYRNNS